ncbi:hypothetical protein IA69_33510, partial [Massilia sp. JS1662]
TTRDPRSLPIRIAGDLQTLFMVPQVAIKVWDCDGSYASEPYAQQASEDMKALATSLTAPYCGLNSGFDVAGWLAEPQAAVSIALIPL